MTDCICPVCKKNFIPAPYHIYVRGTLIYCGWNCYNSVIKKKKPIPAKKAMQVVMKSEEGNILKVFESAAVAAEKTGFLANGIRDACREKRPYMKYLLEYL